VATADVGLVIVPGPVQAYVTPLVVVEPVKVTLGTEQVITPPFDATAVTPAGATLSSVTTTVCDVVHPLEVLVTVNVYVPAVDTVATADVGFVIVPGPVQAYVTPLVVVEPVKVTLGTEQVITPPFDATAVTAAGATLSCVTTTVCDVVQPLEVLVTVKV
jgi:hypothetical protein